MTRRALALVVPVYWVAMAIGSHWPNLDLNQLDPSDGGIPGLDKWLHVGAYAGLTWLLLQSRLLARIARRHVSVVLGVVLVYSIADELTQHLVVGRTVSFGDWLASAGGALLGLGAWALGHWLFGYDREGSGFVAHTRVVSVLTLCSRVLGLIRDWALAFVLGFGPVFDAFVVAFMIPNLFRRLFGEGALAAAFIPHYARLKQGDGRTAWRFALEVLRRLAAFLLAVSAVGLILALLAWWFLPDGRGALAAGLTTVTIWYMPLVCLAAVLGAVLQVHRRFAVPAASPMLLNVILIAAALGAWFWGAGWSAAQVSLLIATAVVAAGLAQLVWHAWATSRVAGAERIAPDLDDTATLADARSRLLRQWTPTVLGLAVLQLNTLLDVLIAMFFSAEPGAVVPVLGGDYPLRLGDVSILAAAARLYEFPLGVFGIAVATAIYPRLAEAAQDAPTFSRLLRQGLRLTVFIGLPASAGLILVRQPLAQAIYGEAGRLEAADAARVAAVLLGYASAVWAYSMNHILVRAFYAREDPITPMKISVGMVGLNLVLNLLLIWPLGAAGLAWSTAICAALQTGVLLLAVRRFAEKPVDSAVRGSWLKTAILTAVMSAAVGGGLYQLPIESLNRIEVIGVLLLATGAGAVIVLLGSRALGMAESRWLLSRGAGISA